MQRIDTATKATDLFGAGKHGFRDGNLGLGINPTQFSADYCNDIQEELMAIIEGAGVAPNTAVVTQVRQAINRMFGGNITTVNFDASPFALTADHAGLVLIDATAGNVVLNLPAANLVTALPIEYVFEKIDATANTATVNRAGANTIDGVTAFALSGQFSGRTIRGNAVDTWLTLSSNSTTAALGQCRLSKSGANLVLRPVGGNQLTIAGVAQTIPDAGVTLAPTALAANTSYFIYAYMVGAVMTLEASATGHSTSTTDGNKGVQIKTGDNTRTLVGQARIITGIAWQDTRAQRFVRSWFNDPRPEAGNFFAANRTTASATYVEMSSTERVEFLCWANERIAMASSGRMANNNVGGAIAEMSLGIDSAAAIDVWAWTSFGGGIVYAPASLAATVSNLPEGYHYVTILGRASAADAVFFGSATAGSRTTLSLTLG
jgi:hypothetical protein